MKAIYLVIGLVGGGIAGFVLARSFGGKSTEAVSGTNAQSKADTSQVATTWNWSDSLDAVATAPQSHKIVYEDSLVRVLQVMLAPGKVEPVHTHQWKSIMWFAQATPMTYYQYGLTNGEYTIKDSMQIPLMPAEVLNRGEIVPVEEPHAVRNTGNKEGIAYRVEFKKNFAP